MRLPPLPSSPGLIFVPRWHDALLGSDDMLATQRSSSVSALQAAHSASAPAAPSGAAMLNSWRFTEHPQQQAGTAAAVAQSAGFPAVEAEWPRAATDETAEDRALALFGFEDFDTEELDLDGMLPS